MSNIESTAANLSFSLPELAGGAGRIAQIVSARRSADISANRAEGLASEEARLRAIQAAKLAGAQRASFAARGVSGPSQGAITRETATLEGLDVGRTVQRASLFAAEVRRRGLATALSATLGIAQDAALFGNAIDERRERDALRRTTILKPHPEVNP